MSVTDEIKDRIDIVDLVSESVEMRRAGRNFTGFCPFHHNVNTPSFVVFPDTQTWKCFGECDEGGDVFNFVMKKEGFITVNGMFLLVKSIDHFLVIIETKMV
jgi:DNA primase